MCILKNKYLLLFCCVLFVESCTPQAPLTPEDAYKTVQQAYRKKDAELLHTVLSARSKDKLVKMISYFSYMDAAQLRKVEQYYRIKHGELKNLNLEKMIFIACFGEHNELSQAVSQNSIVRIDKKNRDAQIHISNGMILHFIKEGPYWKFDMTDL